AQGREGRRDGGRLLDVGCPRNGVTGRQARRRVDGAEVGVRAERDAAGVLGDGLERAVEVGVDGRTDRSGDGDAGQGLLDRVGDRRVERAGAVGILQLADEGRAHGVGYRGAGDARDDPADDARVGIAGARGELVVYRRDAHDR